MSLAVKARTDTILAMIMRTLHTLPTRQFAQDQTQPTTKAIVVKIALTMEMMRMVCTSFLRWKISLSCLRLLISLR